MSNEKFNTARTALENVSSEEQAIFSRKYDKITGAINHDRISIASFRTDPPETADFILDESFENRQTGQVTKQQYRTPQERMNADSSSEHYVETRIQANSPSIRQAKALEYIFGIGVKTGNWLGVKADSRATTVFDDSHNKIDEIITIADEDESVLPFGIDVTIATNPATVQEKLQKSHNSPATRLPEGCSRIIYYEHDGDKRSLPVIPRYVVSISGGFVESIVRSNIQVSPAGIIDVAGQGSQRMLNTRYRILSELYAQAEMRLNQLQLTPSEEQTNLEADALEAIGIQKGIFDLALANIEKALAESSPSLKWLRAADLRTELTKRSMESDRAYATLMQEVEAMNKAALNKHLGRQTMAIASHA